MTRNELIELIRNSPPEGHKAIIKEYGKYVYTIVFNHLRNCGTKEDIEECVSDIFAEFLINFQNSEFYSGDLRASIGTLAKRRSINSYNQLSIKNKKRSELDVNTADSTDIAKAFEKKELQRTILDCIKQLGKPDSDIIILKYYYGLSAREIAKQLSMSAENVQKRSERAVRKLEKLLSDAGIRREQN